MKKNLYFAAECIIIVLLLVIIGMLNRDRVNTAANDAIYEETITEEVGLDETVAEDIIEEFPKEEANPGPGGTNPDESGTDGQDASVQEVDQIPSVTEKELLEERINVVVFGDSIWNDGRGEDGISEQVMEQLNAKFYNCAIGGTTATVGEDESTDLANWTSRSFNGMMYMAIDEIEEEDLIAKDAAYNVMKNVNFEEMDYAIISYGLNDYFSDMPIYPEEYYDMNSFVGALRYGISRLQKYYPDMDIILTSPTYCGWFAGEREFELGRYVESARGVAEELGIHFLDMYHAFGKNPEQKMQYLEDGVHLTKEGRTLYANSVITILEELEKAKETQIDEE